MSLTELNTKMLEEHLLTKGVISKGSKQVHLTPILGPEDKDLGYVALQEYEDQIDILLSYIAAYVKNILDLQVNSVAGTLKELNKPCTEVFENNGLICQESAINLMFSFMLRTKHFEEVLGLLQGNKGDKQIVSLFQPSKEVLEFVRVNCCKVHIILPDYGGYDKE